MPSFNNQDTIKETIESVLLQETDLWELIVVDDGSSDNTIAEIENYSKNDSRIKLYKRNRDPKGGSTCRNIGIQKASGNYIVFLDSDDLLEPYCLRTRLEVMDKYTDLEIGIFLMKKFFANKVESGEIINIIGFTDPLLEYLSGKYPWPITSPIWRKKLLIQLGGFNEKYARMQDPELHIRALLLNCKYKLFYDYPADCLYRITHSKYMTADILHKMILSYNYFYEDFFEVIKRTGNNTYIKAIKCSLKNRLFNISKMNNEPEMLKSALQVPEKIKMINCTLANYLLFKYIIIQKVFFLLKSIRSIIRKYILGNRKKGKYAFSRNKIFN